jgi:tryptophan synthase alpha subunit
MLQYLSGKTGIKFNFDFNLSKRISRLRKNKISKPIFVGVGISTIDQVKHILDSGADGIVLGSSLLNAAIKGNNFLTEFLCRIRETLNGK